MKRPLFEIGPGHKERRQPSRPRRHGASVPILLFVSMALLVLSRVNNDLVDRVRWQVMDVMTPVLSAILIPVEPLRRGVQSLSEYATLSAELERLRAENQKLRGWEWRAKDLERKLASLEAASRTARETGIDFVTARIVSNSSGAFVRSAMINAGERERIRDGYPVLSGDGLVGRIVETGTKAARVLLLTDVKSRIPVHVGEKGVRAIMAGDNGAKPRLLFLAEDSRLSPGDEVRTSGSGGGVPKGLGIGKVAKGGPPYRVELHADLDAADYVGVLMFEGTALDPAKTADGAIDGQSARKAASREP
ncbi:MAG: rod shape-determining protein MreC [Hyphomicrobium sp.]|nr:rod shape-determining protein MreC [Hyphomicrobium sp.]